MQEQGATINDVFRVLGQEYFNKIMLAERVATLEKYIQEEKAGQKPAKAPNE